jgi:NADH-quinone oxidoreductase subunit G
MPRITLNGEVYETDPGRTIIQVADEVGVRIPRYCYHPDIGVEGSCRMCLVEAEGAPKLMPSCATPIRDGLIVRSDTERVREAVRYAMEFLLLHHPIDCPVCDQSGECWLQDYYMELAGHDSRYPPSQKRHRRKAFDIGPTVKLDQERCILCTRCVRFTENVTHTGEIQVLGRGHTARIGIFEDRPLENPYSINVVDVCPVGALTSTDFRFKVRSWFLQGTPSVCAGCSTGCNLRIDHSSRPLGGGIPGYSAHEGTIYRTVGRRNEAVNRSWLCDEGRLSFHALERWPRQSDAALDGKTASVEEALERIHLRFDEIRAGHGAASVAALGSASSTNEGLYLLKRYFGSSLDFRTHREVEDYSRREDDLLRRADKHPNTQGALDIGLGNGAGLAGLASAAEEGTVRGVWITFHPQLVGEDPPEVIDALKRILSAVEFSAVATTHAFDWTRLASAVLPMAAWSEETGTYTNYAGRVQLARRAVAPAGKSRPLAHLIAGLLSLRGESMPGQPDAIFAMLAREVESYRGLDYETIGPLGRDREAVCV